jgi:regulator of nucleoside diphosphate kinase
MNMERNWRDRENLRVLREELARAAIVKPDAVTPDIVTMHSTVRVTDLDTGEGSEFTLVFPEESDRFPDAVSVLAPLGAAVLGYRSGDRIRFRTPKGFRRIEVGDVVYQPEAAGHEMVS